MSQIVNWPKIRLENAVIDMQPGFAQHPGQSNATVPQLRTNNVSPQGTIDLSELIYVSVDEGDLQKYRVKKGDVIFNNTNSTEWVGKTAYFDQEGDYVLSNHMTRLRVNGALIDAEFLALYLHFQWKIGQSRQLSKQWVNQAAIDQATLSYFQIPLPPLPEQRRIAAILREADELRRLRRGTNERTQKIVEAVFYEMFGNPGHWRKTVPLQECVDFVGGGTPNTKVKEYFQGEIPWATSKDIKGRYLYDTQDHITDEAIQNSSTKLVPTNTILIVVKSKILMHSLPISIATCPVCFGQDLKGLVCKPGFEPQFIVAALDIQKARILESARGVNTEGLTLELLRNIPIPQISTYLQEKFVETVKVYDDLLLECKGSKLYLDVIYQSLLGQAFPGELTAAWREAHAAELAEAARERDALLPGLRRLEKALTVQIEKPINTRDTLIDRLNTMQRVLLALIDIVQPEKYFVASRLYDDIDTCRDAQGDYRAELDVDGLYQDFDGLDCSLDTLRRELHALGELGLLKEATLQVEEEAGDGTIYYSTVYRSVRRDDDSFKQDLVEMGVEAVEEVVV